MPRLPSQTSCLPDRLRTGSHIKRGYEVWRATEGGGDEWVLVTRKQHDRENNILLLTLADGTQLRGSGTDKIRSRRTPPESSPTEEGQTE